MPLLRSLGLMDAIVAARFVRAGAPNISWAGHKSSAKAFAPDAPEGFQVDRAVFDELLLRHAASSGAHVLRGSTAIGTTRTDGAAWMLEANDATGRFEVSARFLLDCAGAAGFSPGSRSRTRMMPATFALYAYWGGHGMDSARIHVEAGSDRWYWAAPLADGLANVAVFVGPDALGSRNEPLHDIYVRLLKSSDLLRGCVNGARVSDVRACSAAADVRNDIVGDGYLRAGDAALRIDPLSAQGVHMAMTSALQAAIVAATILRERGKSALATGFYLRQIRCWTDDYLDISRSFYADHAVVEPTPFWQLRSGGVAPGSLGSNAVLDPDQHLTIPPDVRLVETGVLGADRIESALAFDHADLARPIAFINDVNAEQISSLLGSPATASDFAVRLLPVMSEEEAMNSVHELWRRGILRETPAAAR